MNRQRFKITMIYYPCCKLGHAADRDKGEYLGCSKFVRHKLYFMPWLIGAATVPHGFLPTPSGKFTPTVLEKP